jgi:hypothetical protein
VLLKKKLTFYCFTPEAALATFIIEFVLAGYVFFRYKFNKYTQLSILILLLLGTFQLSEYMMCKGADAQLWSKVGTAGITLLPVLTFHLMTLLTRKSNLVFVGYFLGSLIIASIFFLPVPILPYCTGKFVILKFHQTFDLLFGVYYMAFVFMGIGLLVQTWRNHKGDAAELFWAMMIYASFLIPTLLVYIFFAVARMGVPSIMCGFAVLGGIILVFKELPRICERSSVKKSSSKKRK